jgi:hypothetical protein
MINTIIKGIFSLILNLVSLILYPINALVLQYIPGLESAFATIENFFTVAFSYIGWVVDASLIAAETISLIIATYTFRLTLPLLVNSVKLAIKWYNSLKL